MIWPNVLVRELIQVKRTLEHDTHNPVQDVGEGPMIVTTVDENAGNVIYLFQAVKWNIGGVLGQQTIGYG
ncbi:hypothetical protein D3C78_1503430 [compost metagenome]